MNKSTAGSHHSHVRRFTFIRNIGFRPFNFYSAPWSLPCSPEPEITRLLYLLEYLVFFHSVSYSALQYGHLCPSNPSDGLRVCVGCSPCSHLAYETLCALGSESPPGSLACHPPSLLQLLSSLGGLIAVCCTCQSCVVLPLPCVILPLPCVVLPQALCACRFFLWLQSIFCLQVTCSIDSGYCSDGITSERPSLTAVS